MLLNHAHETWRTSSFRCGTATRTDLQSDADAGPFMTAVSFAKLSPWRLIWEPNRPRLSHGLRGGSDLSQPQASKLILPYFSFSLPLSSPFSDLIPIGSGGFGPFPC
jgi:hypothetical protein